MLFKYRKHKLLEPISVGLVIIPVALRQNIEKQRADRTYCGCDGVIIRSHFACRNTNNNRSHSDEKLSGHTELGERPWMLDIHARHLSNRPKGDPRYVLWVDRLGGEPSTESFQIKTRLARDIEKETDEIFRPKHNRPTVACVSLLVGSRCQARGKSATGRSRLADIRASTNSGASVLGRCSATSCSTMILARDDGSAKTLAHSMAA